MFLFFFIFSPSVVVVYVIRLVEFANCHTEMQIPKHINDQTITEPTKKEYKWKKKNKIKKK